MWIYLGDNDNPFNLYDYTTGRGRDGPLTFPKDFNGFLQEDCFSGNLAVCTVIGTILVACLAHARRYFIKAMLNDKEGCNHALTIFQSLFEIERTAKELGLEAPAVKSMRQEEAVLILNEFHKWLQEQYKFAQLQSSFGKALFYCLNNWNELCQYVIDGDLKIDNICRNPGIFGHPKNARILAQSSRSGPVQHFANCNIKHKVLYQINLILVPSFVVST